MTRKLPPDERRISVRGEAALRVTHLSHTLPAAVPLFTLVGLLCPNAPDEDQQPDDTYLPKFDVFYAYSMDQGQNWANEELWFDPPEPALDFTRKIVDPREYIGICWYDDLVWTAYTGTYSGDPYNKAVIWSSRIDWSPP